MEEILSNEETRASFTEHCSKTFCSENIMFWEAVQELKRLSDEFIVPLRGQEIYHKFVQPGSAMQVSLDQEIVDSLRQNKGQLGKDSFDDALASVVVIMENHALSTKFIKTGQDIKMVGGWNHNKLPSDSELAKLLEKELVRMDFQKVHVGMETIKLEEDTKRMDDWCKLLERDTQNNRKQVDSLQKKLASLAVEKDYLIAREKQLTETLQKANQVVKILSQPPI